MPSITEQQAAMVRALAWIVRAICELDRIPDGSRLANGVRGELDQLSLQLGQAVTDDLVQTAIARQRSKRSA
jgi:hypothetical protein